MGANILGSVVGFPIDPKLLNDADLAIIDKRRFGPNKSEVMHIIGDVQGRDCLIVDDIVDTAGTMCTAAEKLKENGAATVTAYCTHAVLSGPAIENLTKSSLDELVVTDTVPLTEEGAKCKKIRQLSLSHLLAESISRINSEESVSSMFLA